ALQFAAKRQPAQRETGVVQVAPAVAPAEATVGPLCRAKKRGIPRANFVRQSRQAAGQLQRQFFEVIRHGEIASEKWNRSVSIVAAFLRTASARKCAAANVY